MSISHAMAARTAVALEWIPVATWHRQQVALHGRRLDFRFDVLTNNQFLIPTDKRRRKSINGRVLLAFTDAYCPAGSSSGRTSRAHGRDDRPSLRNHFTIARSGRLRCASKRKGEIVLQRPLEFLTRDRISFSLAGAESRQKTGWPKGRCGVKPRLTLAEGQWSSWVARTRRGR